MLINLYNTADYLINSLHKTVVYIINKYVTIKKNSYIFSTKNKDHQQTFFFCDIS
jgi:septum formation topological specificity factor MinE